jgi:hypothetical protein
MDSGSLDS